LRNILPATLRNIELQPLKLAYLSMPLFEPEYLITDEITMKDTNISAVQLFFAVLCPITAEYVASLLNVFVDVCEKGICMELYLIVVGFIMDLWGANASKRFNDPAGALCEDSVYQAKQDADPLDLSFDIPRVESETDISVRSEEGGEESIWHEVPSPVTVPIMDSGDRVLYSRLVDSGPLVSSPVRKEEAVAEALSEVAFAVTTSVWDPLGTVKSYFLEYLAPALEGPTSSNGACAALPVCSGPSPEENNNGPHMPADAAVPLTCEVLEEHSLISNVNPSYSDADAILPLRFTAQDGTATTIVGYRLVRRLMVDVLCEQGGSIFYQAFSDWSSNSNSSTSTLSNTSANCPHCGHGYSSDKENTNLGTPTNASVSLGACTCSSVCDPAGSRSAANNAIDTAPLEEFNPLFFEDF
jgi:hypothetical protein